MEINATQSTAGVRRAVRDAAGSAPSRGEGAFRPPRVGSERLQGQQPRQPEPPAPEPFGPKAGPPLPKVEALPVDHPWATPPVIETGVVLRTLYDTGATAERYDVELLEKLNAEYESKPIVAQPRSAAPADMFAAAQRRVRWAHNHVDLRDKRVLEIGCGNGVEVWTMANNLGCDAYGIDVLELGSWETLASDRCHFTCGDMAVDNPYTENSFDRVVSYTVWEHVLHPHRLLEETFRVLKPGGLAWIRANLYAGPKASHRYRDIFFPWPHLLFTDEVVREWDMKHGRRPKGLSWVNRLSMHHYRNYFLDVGFNLRKLSIQECDFDEPFYRRFEDVLGRFPRTDLSQDFFLAVLEKPL